MAAGADLARTIRLIGDRIAHYDVALDGLTVLTEAASGPYLATPILAAAAGADRVLAITRDSSYATAAEVARDTLALARELGVADRLEVGDRHDPAWWAAADVLTNSGFVRPIGAGQVALLKPTAVVALMWEPWEFRADDLDLGACRARGVLVLGTNETQEPCDMRRYAGFLGLRLLFDLGLEGAGARVLLLGDQPSLAVPMQEVLRGLGVEIDWYGSEGHAPAGYDELAGDFAHGAHRYDAVIVAEHVDERPLIAAGGPLTAETLAANPALRVGVISGNVDPEELRRAGVRHLPERIRPVGYMSYQPADLGPLPVLDLYAAGLKVGEVAARARLGGATPREAAAIALRDAPAMDFEGEHAWAS